MANPSDITLESLGAFIAEMDRRALEPPQPIVVVEEYNPELASAVRAGKLLPGRYVVVSIKDRIPLTCEILERTK